MGDIYRTIPWLVSSANTYLREFFSTRKDATVLEFGAGGSTIWLSQQTRHLTTIEHNPEWKDAVEREIATGKHPCFPTNIRLLPLPYSGVCKEWCDSSFDLVLVDGRGRVDCVKESARLVRPGGTLMLDNAERPRYRKVYSILKEWELHEEVQREKDELGFTYFRHGAWWQTNWWIKPGGAV